MNIKAVAIVASVVLLLAGTSITAIVLTKIGSSDNESSEDLDGYYADISDAKSLAVCNCLNSSNENVPLTAAVLGDTQVSNGEYVKKIYKINQSNEYKMIKISKTKQHNNSDKILDVTIEAVQKVGNLFWFKTTDQFELLLDMISGRIFVLSEKNGITLDDEKGFGDSVIYHRNSTMYALLKCPNEEHKDVGRCLFSITIENEVMKIEECNHNLCPYSEKCKEKGLCNVTNNGIIGFSYVLDDVTDCPGYLYYPNGTAARNDNSYKYFDGHYCRNIVMSDPAMPLFPISCTRLLADGSEQDYTYSPEESYLYASKNVSTYIEHLEYGNYGAYIQTGTWEDGTLSDNQMRSPATILNLERDTHSTSVTFVASIVANVLYEPHNALSSICEKAVMKLTVYDDLTYLAERLGDKVQIPPYGVYNYRDMNAYSDNHFYYFDDDVLIQYNCSNGERSEYSFPDILKYLSLYSKNGLTYIKATSTELKDVIITVDRDGKLHKETYEPELIALEIYSL